MQSNSDRKIQQLEQKIAQVSTYRLWTFFGGIALAFGGFQALEGLGAILGMLPAIFLFGWLVKQHQKLEDSLDTFHFFAHYRKQQIARQQLNWQDLPPSNVQKAQADHPFENDLVITGDRSLLRLLNSTLTPQGEQALADLLLRTDPDAASVPERQQQVKELASLHRFRERLALTAHKALKSDKIALEPSLLHQWLEARNNHYQPLNKKLAIAGTAALINFGLIGLHAAGLIAPWWIVGLIVNYLLHTLNTRDVASLMGDAEKVQTNLAAFGSLLAFIENAKFGQRPALEKALVAIRSSTQSPTEFMEDITSLAGRASITQGNALVGFLLNIVIPWDLYHAHKLNSYAEKLSAVLPQWIEAFTQLEVLLSLAEFCALNPEYTFPTFNNEAQPTAFEAKNLGHPLLEKPQKVKNNFKIEGQQATLLLTGSNMSGKSTFLRTIGVNIVLAYAGAPVDADHLQLNAVRLYTCINVSDSLSDGFSYFYAEVRRLRMLLQQMHRQEALPVLYLIDEIFRGTNNKERLIGSRSYVKALSEAKGYGLVSTHDLELVKLEKEIPHLKNYHFRETIKDGKMNFEYLLHQGPSPTTNALRIMQMEGLPVDENLLNASES